MNETLLAYLQDRMKDGNAVLAADKMVTQKEKRAEGWKSLLSIDASHSVWFHVEPKIFS